MLVVAEKVVVIVVDSFIATKSLIRIQNRRRRCLGGKQDVGSFAASAKAKGNWKLEIGNARGS